MRRGTLQQFGFVRADQFDRVLKPPRVGWEVWLAPWGVLIALPPGCKSIGCIEHENPSRGVGPVVVEPAGAASVWPSYRKAEK